MSCTLVFEGLQTFYIHKDLHYKWHQKYFFRCKRALKCFFNLNALTEVVYMIKPPSYIFIIINVHLLLYSMPQNGYYILYMALGYVISYNTQCCAAIKTCNVQNSLVMESYIYFLHDQSDWWPASQKICTSRSLWSLSYLHAIWSIQIISVFHTWDSQKCCNSFKICSRAFLFTIIHIKHRFCKKKKKKIKIG